jgi:hypothetical protein
MQQHWCNQFSYFYYRALYPKPKKDQINYKLIHQRQGLQGRYSLHTLTLVWLPNAFVGLVAKPLGQGEQSVWNLNPIEYVSLPHAAIVGLDGLGTYLYPGGLAAMKQ